MIGDNRKIYNSKLVLLCSGFLFLAAGDIAIASAPPGDVAGNWTIH